eukprot:COSAG02_NODE_131_length_34710_cov_17.171159_33_plen_82_part_00
MQKSSSPRQPTFYGNSSRSGSSKKQAHSFVNDSGMTGLELTKQRGTLTLASARRSNSSAANLIAQQVLVGTQAERSVMAIS